MREFALNCRVSLAFRWIPPGRVASAEGPARAVRDGFWMAETETTVAVWRQVMGLQSAVYPAELSLPVAEVSWDDCIRFIGRLHSPGEGWRFQLPTELQWEHACRAGSTADFHRAPASIGWLDANADGKAHPVGLLPANDWGLRDMHGNVAEWCLDPADPKGRERIIRGGSWDSDLSAAASSRNSDTPTLRINRVGFRLAIVRIHP